MGQPDQISAETGSCAVRAITMYYHKEQKDYCKVTNVEAFSLLAWIRWSKEFNKHSLLWLLGQFFKNERKQISKKQKILSSEEKSIENFFCKLLYEVGFFAYGISISLKNTSWLFAVQTVGTGLRLHLPLQNPLLIKYRYKGRTMLEDRGFCQTILSLPSSS